MGRSVGFKCECGGYPRYIHHEGRVVMNCNKCGWWHETNEQWDPAKHDYELQSKPKNEINAIGVLIGGILGFILSILFGFFPGMILVLIGESLHSSIPDAIFVIWIIGCIIVGGYTGSKM